MNILLTIGLLLIIGYTAGWLLNKIGLPKIIGYIATGIAFSPSTVDFIDHDIAQSTQPLLDVCLAFIAFEVGGALKWSRSNYPCAKSTGILCRTLNLGKNINTS